MSRNRQWGNAHIIASVAVLAVLLTVGPGIPKLSDMPQGMRVVMAMMMLALSPLLVPALLVGAPVYAVVKGIVPTYWLAVEWGTYIAVAVVVIRIQRPRVKP